MSYASLDEAFPSIDEGPPTKKTKKSKKGQRPEPLIIEPDRPAERPSSDVEVMKGPVADNTRTSSPSNYLVAAPDPAEDYFPYPLGADKDTGAFMLQPDWASQFALKMGVKHQAETPVAPAVTPIDGYSTLWRNIPDPKLGTANEAGRSRSDVTNAIGVDDDIREKVDQILKRLDGQEYKTAERDTFSEILLFVFLGVAIILLLDLFFRSQQFALAHMLTASFRHPVTRQHGGGPTHRAKLNNFARMMKRLKLAGFI
jgi:hypothetical protein